MTKFQHSKSIRSKLSKTVLNIIIALLAFNICLCKVCQISCFLFNFSDCVKGVKRWFNDCCLSKWPCNFCLLGHINGWYIGDVVEKINFSFEELLGRSELILSKYDWNERNLYHFDAIHLLLKILDYLFMEPNTLKKFKRFWCINVKIWFLSSYWWQSTQPTQKLNLLNFQEYYSFKLDLLVLNSWSWNIMRIGKLRIL